MKTLHLFLINPAAGIVDSTGKLTARIRDAFSSAVAPGEEFEILKTKGPGDAVTLTREACRNYAGKVRVYACGGDGTLNEVVNGAVGCSNAAVCPVPIGSGNDFIRTLEPVPRKRFLDIAACVRGREVPCDVLKSGSAYSINSISVGLDAITAKRQEKVKRFPLVSGPMAYKLALGYSFLSAMKNKIRVEADGKPLEDIGENIVLAVAGNGKFYGGGFQATPYADISDGLIELVAIKTISRLEFLKYVSIYKRGEHIGKIPCVHYRRCKKVKLFAEKPVTMQFDGEVTELKDPEIEILPGALRLVIPEKERKPLLSL